MKKKNNNMLDRARAMLARRNPLESLLLRLKILAAVGALGILGVVATAIAVARDIPQSDPARTVAAAAFVASLAVLLMALTGAGVIALQAFVGQYLTLVETRHEAREASAQVVVGLHLVEIAAASGGEAVVARLLREAKRDPRAKEFLELSDEKRLHLAN